MSGPRSGQQRYLTRAQTWEGEIVTYPFLEVEGVSGVYAIVHDPTGRRYIGQSENLRNRFVSHRGSLRTGRSPHKPLQKLWSETLEQDWLYVVLAYGEPSLWEAEQCAIELAGEDALNKKSRDGSTWFRRGWLHRPGKHGRDPRMEWINRRLAAGIPVFAVALHADIPVEVILQYEAGARRPENWQYTRMHQALDEAKASWSR